MRILVHLRRSIGYVPQEGGSSPHRSTVADNVATVPAWRASPSARGSVTARELLGPGSDWKPDWRGATPPSLAPRQRVGVGQAPPTEPYCWTDEPFGRWIRWTEL